MQTHPEPHRLAASPFPSEDDEFFSLRITLHTIKLLDALAQHGSVAAAARALCLSEAALDTTLQTLEQNLGLTLFFPGGLPLQPTPACRALLNEGRLLLQAQHADTHPLGHPLTP